MHGGALMALADNCDAGGCTPGRETRGHGDSDAGLPLRAMSEPNPAHRTTGSAVFVSRASCS
jgi:hypothetical protein